MTQAGGRMGGGRVSWRARGRGGKSGNCAACWCNIGQLRFTRSPLPFPLRHPSRGTPRRPHTVAAHRLEVQVDDGLWAGVEEQQRARHLGRNAHAVLRAGCGGGGGVYRCARARARGRVDGRSGRRLQSACGGLGTRTALPNRAPSFHRRARGLAPCPPFSPRTCHSRSPCLRPRRCSSSEPWSSSSYTSMQHAGHTPMSSTMWGWCRRPRMAASCRNSFSPWGFVCVRMRVHKYVHICV